MPAYSSSTIPYVVSPGDVQILWNNENPAAGNGGASASVQVALGLKEGRPETPFAIKGFFSAAPGAFEIDVQVSDVDLDAEYQTISGGNITTVDATNQTFYLTAKVTAKFVRLLRRTGAVGSITARIIGG